VTDRVRDLLDRRGDPAEREPLARSLPASERDEARALLALSRAAAALPRPVPSAGFVERAMLRARTRRPPRRPAAVWRWLTARQLSPLETFAAAAAAAVLAVAVPHLRAPPAPTPTPATGVVARLAYRAPLARDVRVAGDFNGWKPEATPLRRAANGVWSIEVPLEAGRRYQYMFVVDGAWVTDPAAPVHVDDGFGGQNAVLDI